MVMYKVTKADFKGKKENKFFEKNKEYDFPIKRAEEINNTLRDEHNIYDNLVRVEEKEK